MNNILSFPRVALFVLAVGTAGVTATFAQTAPTTTSTDTTDLSGSGKHHHHGGNLTPQEKAQVKKDRDEVLSNDPSLKTEDDSLKQQHETLKASGASKVDKKAFHQELRAFKARMHDAMVKLDPSVAPILAKLEAGHHHHKAAE